LKNHAIFDRLFEFLRDKISKADLILNDGSIVDARIIEIPKQRNSRDENGQLKKEEVPEDWKENQSKLSQCT
jgi:IS5 family transposase